MRRLALLTGTPFPQQLLARLKQTPPDVELHVVKATAEVDPYVVEALTAKAGDPAQPGPCPRHLVRPSRRRVSSERNNTLRVRSPKRA